MAAKTDINFAELIDLSVGTPEVVNYKGLRVLLAAIVSQLGVNNVSLVVNEAGWNEGYQKDLYDVREAKRKDEADKPARPSTGNAGAGRQETNISDIEKSRSIDNAGRPSSIEEIVAKVSRIEGQLNALPSNQSLLSRSGSSADGKTTPVSDMWQLMQVQKKAAANEEGVSKLMSMVQDMMRELQTISQQLQDHSSNISDLQQQHTNFGKDIDKIKEFNKTVESRLSSLEQSSGQQDKIDELNKLMDDLRNQLALLPHVDEIVTWPGFEAALKGAYKESVQHSESGMQTAPMVDNTRMQTRPLNDAFAQTNTPTPPTPPGSRPVSSRSTRSGVSVASVHPTSELQRLLRELGELTGRHNLLEDRVNGLEELLAKKADLSAVEALMAQGSVPDDLAAKLAELEEGLNHLRDSKLKLSELEARLSGQASQCPASLEDITALRQELGQAIADLAESQSALAKDVSQLGSGESTMAPPRDPAEPRDGEAPLGDAGIDARLLDELEHRLDSSLRGLSGNVQTQLTHVGNRISSLEKSLREQLKELAAMINSQPMKVRSAPKVQRVVEEQMMTSSLDSDILKNLQSALKDLQAEVDKLNTSYVHLVDEHNVKQKHIDALYTFVDRLQENKADKEHVIMEIDVKADKHALDNKVSRSHFDGTVDELSKNLNEVMDKMAGHKVAWDSAVGELKLDIDNKLDRMELDPLKSYLDNRIKSVSAKYVRKEVETGEDAAGFRKPLQKFHCISCDRPLDMTPQAPVASLPENKGLPGSRSGRPYTTFELEQIRAAQKNVRPGRNVQHYEQALFRQELARQRRQDILAYLVHFDRGLGIGAGVQGKGQGQGQGAGRGQELGPLEHPPSKLGYLPAPFRNVQHMHTYGYQLVDSGNYQDVPDYFVASRSCGGSHTMTFPHRRITRVSQMTNMVTTTEDLSPVVNGRVEADIQGQDGHIYKARLDAGHMTERLPVLTQPKMMRAKSPRVSSARGRRSHPPSRQAPDPSDPIPPLPTGAGAQRPSSARASPRPTSARPPSAATGRALSTAGSSAERTSPVPAPANTVDDVAAATPAAGGTGVQSPSPPPQQDPITVPQPPPDQDQS